MMRLLICDASKHWLSLKIVWQNGKARRLSYKSVCNDAHGSRSQTCLFLGCGKTVEAATTIEAEEKALVEVKDGTVDMRITTKKAYCIKSFGQIEERVQSSTVEQTVDAPAPQMKEEIIADPAGQGAEPHS